MSPSNYNTYKVGDTIKYKFNGSNGFNGSIRQGKITRIIETTNGEENVNSFPLVAGHRSFQIFVGDEQVKINDIMSGGRRKSRKSRKLRRTRRSRRSRY